MNFRKICAAIVLLAAGPAMAGQPVETKLTCPVGGEAFTVTGTLSCSNLGRTMSFRPVTTCDFRTRLPVCPGNGLPMYSPFSDAQVTDLTAWLESEEFAAAKALPKWQRAYVVAEHLGQAGTNIGFGLMLQALWFEEAEFLASDSAMDTLLEEAKGEVERVPEMDGAFVHAIMAYGLARAGRMEDAEEQAAAAEVAGDGNADLEAYLVALRACFADMSAEACQPDAAYQP
ncbi:hypothetical protein [Algicella marina]|uniref:Uncharacterized protein n=1 Tax=Algicella marina TaxID=2683284 RepID=A0A6P1T400_9RHOB|nr:hypothetical protein [Algicella marina]QHQ36423.1 hypothetical protein GO499_15185 [Algicella marina]